MLSEEHKTIVVGAVGTEALWFSGITNYSNFVYLCDEDKLNILMNEGNNWRILSNYLVNIWEKRKHIMYK